MLNETVREILHYLTRLELEVLQMHSRFLRDIVNRDSGTLPLRSIYKITANGASVAISLEKGSYKECNTFEVSKLTRSSLGLLVDRINKAFVERLTVDFTDKDEVRFLRYLKNRAADLECRIETLSIGVADEPRSNIDYAMVDFVACRLRPQELDVGMYDSQLVTPHAMLFDHASMRSTLKRVKFHGYEEMSAAICMIPALLNVDTLQTCGIHTDDDATPWILRFAKAFETVSEGAIVVQSVAVVRSCTYHVPAPPSEDFSPFGNPHRKNVPAPHSDFIEKFFGNLDVNESTAELFVFKNARLRKRLDVYAWTAAKRALRKSRNLYGLFLLQINDM